MNEEVYPRLEALCRLCLKKDIDESGSVEIFPSAAVAVETISIPMRIMACAALEVQPSDGLPKSLCTDCRYQLEKSYYFRKRSQATDSKLRKHIRLLSLGKKSRVFIKQDPEDEDDDEELEFVDSLNFLKEHDDRSIAEEERKQNEMKNLELEVRACQELAKKRREEIAVEVREEIRTAVVAELKEELRLEVRADVKCELRVEMERKCIELAKRELRAEVKEDCHQQEKAQLLSELEEFWMSKRSSKKTQQTSLQLVVELDKAPYLKKNVTETKTMPKITPKRLPTSPPESLLRTKQKYKPITTISTNELIVSSLSNTENTEKQPTSLAYQVTLSPETLDVEQLTETEPNFYILNSEDGNDLEQTNAEVDDQQEEPHTLMAKAEEQPEEDAAICIKEFDTENFRLAASDNIHTDTTSYQIEDNGEIHFKNEGNKSIEQSDDEEEQEENEEDEESYREDNADDMVFNYNNDTVESEDNIEYIEFVSMDKTNSEAMTDENYAEEPSSNVHIKKTRSSSANETFNVFNKNIPSSVTLVSQAGTVAAFEIRTTDTPKNFACNTCPLGFSMKRSLIRHQRTHKKTEEKGETHMCPNCYIYLSCRSALRRHMLIHNGTKEFVCNQCDKSFVQREVLKRHMKTHTGERPFPCPHCDRKYKQKGNLMQHISLNHMNAPMILLHKCHLCPKRFNHASGLSRHLASHSGVAYQCSECDRTFGDRSSVKRHITNIHGNNKSVEKTCLENLVETAKDSEKS